MDYAMTLSVIIIAYICRRILFEVTLYSSPLLFTVLGIIIAKYRIFNKLH